MVVFGLGNPGREYERTRHNLGFMVLDRLAHDLGARFRMDRDRQLAHVQISGVRCELVKPMGYMNNSGVAARGFLEKHHDDFLVVFDDIDLPFGRIRIRTRGSDGGHQGMADIIRCLETMNFPRVRMGIGVRTAGLDDAVWVLDRFTEAEESHLPDVVAAGRDAVVTIVENGITPAMNRCNALNLMPSSGPSSSGPGSTKHEAKRDEAT